MSGQSLMLTPDGTEAVWTRLPFGQTAGRNEAWLRDLLHKHPDLIPLQDLDPAYGPLFPVCTELQTPAGRIDNVFIDPNGRLTLVECKLWNNVEARRKVIAQILDYAKELGRWSVADLEAKVAARLGPAATSLFGIASRFRPGLQENVFNDGVTRSLRDGKFQLLVAGDGIREEVRGIADLINRNSTSAFSLGLFQVELYEGPQGALLVQPRVVARTQLIQRTVIVVQENGHIKLDEELAAEPPAESTGELSRAQQIHAAAADWWKPVLLEGVQNQEQEPFRYYWPNHVRGALPWPGTWITAYRSASGAQPVVGVFVGGRNGADTELLRALEPQWPDAKPGLPEGTEFDGQKLQVVRPLASFKDEDAARQWLIGSINQFVNEVRPRALALTKA